ncbi:Npun_F0296 family exosortase-dependent surface protein [Nostoc sp. 'Peltigera malacea cyanobiont' DB3992]|uniref:Npun_F0296 family exosortase-dependent surface protein n=1 Tax=Nostoc sp. 'Peltigera malacea cyanobiont' DB3992 TaxID=1206980 RepID=UPI000C0402FB|nr:PEP-CTERM sorting domain-containing protein [Nostoc sp. 'Peltigera malacea cyanobiont' DB3992]PHM06468.1 PEP-CTERM sorting domain-containing protein [Nostoc sp. 'Peltigera malacea cyanobiont' DB3992]
MLQKISLALLGMTAVVMSANPASAITLQVNSGPFSSYADAKTVTFDNGTANDPNGFVTYSNITSNIVQGSVSSQYASPYGDNTKFLTIAPVGSNVAGDSGLVNIKFKEAVNYFGFYAGSLDSYNFVDIYKGDQKLKTFSGADVPTAIANGSWTSTEANMFINLVADTGETFDRVVMRSDGVAFETDNHAYRLASVPEPSAMLGVLAIGACGMMSVFKRSQHKAIVKG